MAAALHGERRHLIEDAPQRRLVAGRLLALAEAVQMIGLLEDRERVQLEALAREVLVEQLAAPEAHLVADRRVRHARPVLAVALELEKDGGHAARDQAPPEGERFHRGEHVAQLGGPRSAEAPERAGRAHVGGAPAPVLRPLDVLAADLPAKGGVDRAPPPLRRGARHHDGRPGSRGRRQGDLGARGHRRVVHPVGAISVHLDHRPGVRRSGGNRRHDGRDQCRSLHVPHSSEQRPQ